MDDKEARDGASDSAVPLPPWRTEVQRRAKRGPAPQLDRERIVARALEIIDADGIGALSLRRLADDLGVTPMSLYWHVADKAALLELVGHAVLAEIVLPERVGSWTDQLRDIHRAMFVSFLRHRNTTEILVGRARFGPGGLAAFERILAILLDAGFTPEAAFDAYQSLYLFTLGFMATSSRTPEFIAVQREGAEYMLTLPFERFPSIRAVTPVIGRRPLEDLFEIGLDVVIAGIAARLGPAAADRSPDR
ncbi:MAG TPA: TetR/AcrR family transcriptional regulator C-terminal domain-containing protein [Candidatus Limnocylindrales bacterium]|nr:TetR/AcrR family transcriptional regulator C-terminal domain-containing protein [Candidatus Limnocylindrales bacterium]